VFPQLFNILGAPPSWYLQATHDSVQADVDRFGFGRSFVDLIALPWRLVSSPEAFRGSLGPLFLLLVPLALLARPFRRVPLWVVVLAAGGYFVLWASPLSSFQARFLVPLAPLLAVLAAAGLSALVRWLRASGLRRLAVAAPFAVLALLVLNLPVFVPRHGDGYVQYTLRDVDVAAAVDPGRASDVIAANVQGYGALRYAARELDPDAKILSVLQGGQYYSKQRRLVDYAPLAQPMTWSAPVGNEARVYAALRAAGFGYVLIDEERTDFKAYPLAITGNTFREQYLRPVYQDSEATLYAVRAPGDVGPA